MTLLASPPITVYGPAAAPSERIRLWGWSEEFQSCVNSLLFGEMVRKAIPTLAHYHGDLFHDARWMERYVTGPTTFWWVHREWGTNIGDDGMMLQAVLNANRGEHVKAYRIEVTVEGGEWFATFTPLPTLP